MLGIGELALVLRWKDQDMKAQGSRSGKALGIGIGELLGECVQH